MTTPLLQHLREIIDEPHENIHRGITFETSYKSPEGGDIADNGVLGLLIQTGQTEAHYTFQAAAGGDAELRLYRDATFSVTGTVMQAFNLNHTSGITPIIKHYINPVFVTGTMILNVLQPGGTGPSQSSGGTADHDIERTLRTGTAYYLESINRAGSGQPMSFWSIWYEEND